jgi:hypothetical protein
MDPLAELVSRPDGFAVKKEPNGIRKKTGIHTSHYQTSCYVPS